MKRLIPVAAIFAFLWSVGAYGQGILPYVEGTFTKNDGTPLAGGKICTTTTGTSTSLATYPTYADAVALTNANTNPVTLDSAGRANIWLKANSSYRIIIYNSGTGNTCNGSSVGSAIKTVDAVTTGVSVINAITINGVQMCDQYPGATAGAKIAACIAALPTTGGIADANGLQGSQSINSDPFFTVTKPVQLLVSGATYGINTPVTIPANFQVVMAQGAIFSVSPSQTLTMNGSLDGSSTSLHFSGSGTTRIGPGKIREILPQWFGAMGDGSTNDTTAIQSAMTACGNSSRGAPIRFLEGEYIVTSSLNSYCDILGSGNHQGGTGVSIKFTGTGFAIRQRTPYTVGARTTNLRIDLRTNANAGNGGIEAVEGMVLGIYENVEIYGNAGNTDYGIYLRGDATGANNTVNTFIKPNCTDAATCLKVGDDVSNGMGSNTIVENPFALRCTAACIEFSGGSNTVIGGDLTASGAGYVIEYDGGFSQNNSIVSVELSSGAGGGGVKMTASTTGSQVFSVTSWRVSDVLGTLVSDATSPDHQRWVNLGSVRSLGKTEGPGILVQREGALTNTNTSPGIFGGSDTGFLHIAGQSPDASAGRVILGANTGSYSATHPVDANGVTQICNTSSNARIASSSDTVSSLTTKYYVDCSNGAIFERTRTNALGAAIAITFSAGNFTGSGAMTWTVGSGDVTTNYYTLAGTQLTWNFVLGSTDVAGVVDTDLKITLPASLTITKTFEAPTMFYSDNGGAITVGRVRGVAGETAIRLKKIDGSNWTASAGATSVSGNAVFEVN